METDRAWLDMADAPKDGTEVDLLIRHRNYHYATTAKDRAMWEEVVRAKWIDFNGGGWTWSGIAGNPVGFRRAAASIALPADTEGR